MAIEYVTIAVGSAHTVGVVKSWQIFVAFEWKGKELISSIINGR